MGKMAHYLGNHNSICVGVSGGSDSNIIVHMIATYFREYLPKIHFLFQNTGIEYKATLNHLDYMEKRYDIKIDRIHGEGVVSATRKYGVPILSKEYSELVEGAARGAQWAIKKSGISKFDSPYGLTRQKQHMLRYLVRNNREIKVSPKCCEISKKAPYRKYMKEIQADLSITGERQREGGIRAAVHTDCFESGKYGDKYMPLWFWDNETKQYYKDSEKIVYSDCYEIWGMKRTGCVGCPFNAYAGRELKMMKKFEPDKYRLSMKIFGTSYKVMDMFDIHREKILNEEEYDLIKIPDTAESDFIDDSDKEHIKKRWAPVWPGREEARKEKERMMNINQ